MSSLFLEDDVVGFFVTFDMDLDFRWRLGHCGVSMREEREREDGGGEGRDLKGFVFRDDCLWLGSLISAR